MFHYQDIKKYSVDELKKEIKRREDEKKKDECGHHLYYALELAKNHKRIMGYEIGMDEDGQTITFYVKGRAL